MSLCPVRVATHTGSPGAGASAAAAAAPAAATAVEDEEDDAQDKAADAEDEDEDNDGSVVVAVAAASGVAVDAAAFLDVSGVGGRTQILRLASKLPEANEARPIDGKAARLRTLHAFRARKA